MEINAIRKCTVLKTHNWYIVQIPKESEECIYNNVVFQIDDERYEDTEAEQRALMDLFYHLKEYFWVLRYLSGIPDQFKGGILKRG